MPSSTEHTATCTEGIGPAMTIQHTKSNLAMYYKQIKE